jgi:hypothetical protein
LYSLVYDVSTISFCIRLLTTQINLPFALILVSTLISNLTVSHNSTSVVRLPDIMAAGWRKLNVAVVGGGIGGMCVAIALRRAGHDVVIYERSDFAGEVGASVSCAANGTRWLHEWKVDVAKGDPVVLKQLINRDWKTGEPISEYSLDDYEERWGHVYNMFHRQYMHAMLKESALEENGEGTPAKLVVNHKVWFCITYTDSYAQRLTSSFSAKPST